MSSERFEIVVRGQVSPQVLAGLEEFDATYCTDGHTHLIGAVPDWSTIAELFNRLLGPDVELVSVNPVRA